MWNCSCPESPYRVRHQRARFQWAVSFESHLVEVSDCNSEVFVRFFLLLRVYEQSTVPAKLFELLAKWLGPKVLYAEVINDVKVPFCKLLTQRDFETHAAILFISVCANGVAIAKRWEGQCSATMIDRQQKISMHHLLVELVRPISRFGAVRLGTSTKMRRTSHCRSPEQGVWPVNVRERETLMRAGKQARSYRLCPTRALPLPFCARSLAPDPRTSPMPFEFADPWRRHASCHLTTWVPGKKDHGRTQHPRQASH